MTHVSWQVVEKWQTYNEIGTWELYLKQIDDVFSKAWRVEWCQKGHQRQGVSFTGDDREQRARDELERRRARFAGRWDQVI